MSAGRVVMISGANRGIGAAIARKLAAEGWRLSLGMRNPQLPPGVEPRADLLLCEYDAIAGNEQAWVDATLEQFGRIDAIVPNAGIMLRGSAIDGDEQDLDAMWAVNVKAPRRLAKAAWPALIESGRGRVLLISSLSGKRVASAAAGMYSMSKYAVIALAHALRREGWDHGIRATALCPGLVATDMGRALYPDKEDMTRPEDVARLAALALDMDNSASVAELYVNCSNGEIF